MCRRIHQAGKYRDRYRENLRALIETKIQAQPMAQGITSAVRRPVVDILKALQSSLASAKKPVKAGHGLAVGAKDADPEIRRRSKKPA